MAWLSGRGHYAKRYSDNYNIIIYNNIIIIIILILGANFQTIDAAYVWDIRNSN